MRKAVKRTGVTVAVLLLLFIAFAVWFHFRVTLEPPFRGPMAEDTIAIHQPEPGLYTAGNGWLKKGSGELWEMYVEGDPLERGVVMGKLTKHLMVKQEEAFINRIRELIPSDFYLRFLKYFVYWFNRDLDIYIPRENLEEIYGISRSASADFSAIGDPYQRMLNYHSAHDVGHALQEMALVGCSSFGVWGDRTSDGNLLIGRNFDFYAGDEFAENKIVAFIKPTKGHAFMMITWGGMTGAVSGMNDAGLTVTINAAKSAIPASARTPVSILARHILQYASDISEAVHLASGFETFVSESFLIGSAKDNLAVIIEKSPFAQVTVNPQSGYIASTNHFLSPVFANDPENRKDMIENASLPRYRRLQQAITNAGTIDQSAVASILRDRSGLNGTAIGNGNEKALNQLIAHHSVIFKPSTREAWISTGPWQIGTYVCYNLDEIFHNFARLKNNTELTDPAKMIGPDPFIGTFGYDDFLRFREMKRLVSRMIQQGQEVPDNDFLKKFRSSNPDCWEVYALSGDYFLSRKMYNEAADWYLQALNRSIPRWKEKEELIKNLAKCRLEAD